jgi:fructose-1,6-bisphosphatase
VAARTLTRYLLDLERDGARSGAAQILSAVAVSVKLTAALISRGALILGDATARGTQRVDVRLRRLATAGILDQTSAIAPLAGVALSGSPALHQVSATGRYVLAFEALHGLANLTDNLPVGSAFSLRERRDRSGPCTVGDFLQRGSRQVAAGIAVYGPRTVLVLTTGQGVDGFTLDRDVGNFVLTHPQLRIPADAHLFAVNAAEAPHWPAPVKRYVEECMRGSEGPRGHDFTMRWNASALVGAYRVLTSGGLFLVPPVDHAGGWLSPLLFTASPLALLAEQAGGAASTGTQRVLDVQPRGLDARVPLYLGGTGEVARIESYFSAHELGYDKEFSHPLFHSRTLFTD